MQGAAGQSALTARYGGQGHTRRQTPCKDAHAMMIRPTLAALLLAGLAFSPVAQAACTDAQAEAKMTELSNALGPLAMRNPTEAQKITEEMMSALGAPTSDATCTLYDRLLVRARR